MRAYMIAENYCYVHYTRQWKQIVDALEQNRRPPINVFRAIDFTAPGICAHKSAMKGGVWVDVARFD